MKTCTKLSNMTTISVQAILCTHKHEEEEALDEKLGVPH
jgi:hypothetical protein